MKSVKSATSLFASLPGDNIAYLSRSSVQGVHEIKELQGDVVILARQVLAVALIRVIVGVCIGSRP